MNIPNLDLIRSWDGTQNSAIGSRIYEALNAFLTNQNIIAQQTNSNVSGEPSAPPQINGVTVNGQNGHFQVAIADNNMIYRNVHYFVDHADNPQFTNFQTEHLGPSRNANLFLGNTTRYFRAYSSYGASPSSAPVYHGSQSLPLAVVGGGSVGAPKFLAGQGSGTSSPGEPFPGQGSLAFRSADGKPPVR